MPDILKSNKEKDLERIYFPELDGLRFFAFLLVFIHHQVLLAKVPFISVLNKYGWIGVDLFFVLSAFLFTKLLVAEHNKTKTISFRKFYIRRIFRIWPIYFLFITFSLAVYFLFPGITDDHIQFRIAGLFTFTDNIVCAIYGYNPLPYVAHLWTISYEEQFYVFIPIIILLLVRTSVKNKLIAAGAVFILFNAVRIGMIANDTPHPAIWVLPVTHFESIFLGIIIGFGGFDFLLRWAKPLLLGAIGIVFFFLLLLLPDLEHISYWLTLNYTFVGLSTALVLFSVIKSDILKKALSKKWLIFLGKRSYGLYLYHFLGNEIASYITTHISILPSNAVMYFIYSLSFTVIVSIISYKLIETPFLKLKKKFEIITSRPI